MKKAIAVILTVLLLIVVYAIWLRPNEILSNEESKALTVQEASRFFEWKGNQIHYTDEGEGPVLLMIHGFAGSFYNFQAISQTLKKDFRVIRPDVPGMGLSEFNHGAEGIDYFEEYKDFFSAFLNHLELDSFYVMGNSLGGVMASLVASEAPEKVQGLFLLNSAGYEMDKVIVKGAGPLRWKWFKPVMAKGFPMQVVELFVTMPFADKSKVDKSEFPIDYALVNRAGVIPHLSNLATSGQEPDTAMIARIKAPTVIIWGEEDIIIPAAHARRFERDIPGSEVKIYSPCGHMPMMELPDSIVKDVYFYIEKWKGLKQNLLTDSGATSL